jgi:hypothetical protein
MPKTATAKKAKGKSNKKGNDAFFPFSPFPFSVFQYPKFQFSKAIIFPIFPMPLYPTIFPFANFYVVHLSLTILANRSGYVHFRFDDDFEESLRFCHVDEIQCLF